ncbi:unnamed protein product [Caenorhabditis nigoni]
MKNHVKKQFSGQEGRYLSRPLSMKIAGTIHCAGCKDKDPDLVAEHLALPEQSESLESDPDDVVFINFKLIPVEICNTLH